MRNISSFYGKNGLLAKKMNYFDSLTSHKAIAGLEKLQNSSVQKSSVHSTQRVYKYKNRYISSF